MTLALLASINVVITPELSCSCVTQLAQVNPWSAEVPSALVLDALRASASLSTCAVFKLLFVLTRNPGVCVAASQCNMHVLHSLLSPPSPISFL